MRGRPENDAGAVLRTRANTPLRCHSRRPRRSDLRPPCLRGSASATRPSPSRILVAKRRPKSARSLMLPSSRPCGTPSRRTSSLNSFALSYISSSSADDITSRLGPRRKICHASAAPVTREYSARCNPANSGRRNRLQREIPEARQILRQRFRHGRPEETASTAAFPASLLAPSKVINMPQNR